MIQFTICGIRIEIHFLFVGVLTMFLLIDPTGISALGLFASVIHEMGHVVALIITGYRPKRISFEMTGICLNQNNHAISYLTEIFILLAGSLTNFLIFFWCLAMEQQLDKVGVWAMIHLMLGIVNLLPMNALDGGKILRIILLQCCNVVRTDHIVFWVQLICVFVVTAFCILSVLTGKTNFTALIFCTYLIASMLLSKT